MPFLSPRIPSGKKGNGILRAKPDVHWHDLGNEPLRERAQFPMVLRDGEFAGERVNDLHLSVG